MNTRAWREIRNWNANDVGEEKNIPTSGFTMIRLAGRFREGAWGSAVFGVGYKLSESDIYRDFASAVTLTSAAPTTIVYLDAIPFITVRVNTAEGAEDSIDIDAFMTDQE